MNDKIYWKKTVSVCEVCDMQAYNRMSAYQKSEYCLISIIKIPFCNDGNMFKQCFIYH